MLLIISCLSACESQQKKPSKEPKTFYGKTIKKTKDLKESVEDKSGVSKEVLEQLDRQ